MEKKTDKQLFKIAMDFKKAMQKTLDNNSGVDSISISVNGGKEITIASKTPQKSEV